MASIMASAMGVLQFLAAHLGLPLTISVFLLLLIGHLRRSGDSSLVYLPIVGMLPSLVLRLHRVHDWLTSVMEERGCTFKFTGPWFSGMNYVVTSDPENVRYVTSTNFNNFLKGTHLREIFDGLGDNITTTEFDEWRIRRRLTQNLLHQPEFLRSIRRVIHEKVEGGLLPLLSHFAQRGGEGMVDMREVLQRFAVPRSWWKLLRWLGVGWEKKLSESMEILDDFIGEVIASRKDALSKGCDVGPEESNAPFDLLTGFINQQMVDATGKFDSDKSIRDHTLELLSAGKDSTSLSLAWFFWVVSQHPSVEGNIVSELATAIQTDGARRRGNKYVFFDPEELDGCVYLNAAIYESLRLFPAVPLAPRWAMQRDVLPSGDKVEPGTVVMFSAYAMGRMEKIWGEDRLEFKPERWISSQGKLREESSYKLAVFGAGPRICLGKSLAFGQIRAVAAAVTYNFHFQVAEGHQVSPRGNIVLDMKNGLMGSLRERCHP